MKIFGINITTKKELCECINGLKFQLDSMIEAFPFSLGQVVYDVALKNEKGRYTKTKPSREYSTITPVEVTEKNYFNLVKRYRNNDVFVAESAAEAFLNLICK